MDVCPEKTVVQIGENPIIEKKSDAEEKSIVCECQNDDFKLDKYDGKTIRIKGYSKKYFGIFKKFTPA